MMTSLPTTASAYLVAAAVLFTPSIPPTAQEDGALLTRLAALEPASALPIGPPDRRAVRGTDLPAPSRGDGPQTAIDGALALPPDTGGEVATTRRARLAAFLAMLSKGASGGPLVLIGR